MRLSREVLAAVVALAAAFAACDPVHDDAVSALGDEAPGVHRGPLHRPGQPCVTCHDGALGNPPKFTVAGTIYQTASSLTPAAGATVTLTSSDGSQPFSTTTNAAGNFYVVPREYTPVFPMKVAVTYQGATVQMTTHVGRDSSCADCHSDPAGPTSAGHVYAVQDGATQ